MDSWDDAASFRRWLDDLYYTVRRLRDTAGRMAPADLDELGGLVAMATTEPELAIRARLIEAADDHGLLVDSRRRRGSTQR